MRQLFYSILFLLSGSLLAQDTLTVQTFTFDSITTRRATFLFPDTTHHFRKVLMLHTLKCDAATQQDQFACGEWDYLTYNKVWEHTGILDSTATTRPFYQINVATPDSTALSEVPLYDQQQRYSLYRTVDASTGETDYPTGSGDASDAITLDASGGSGRTQFILGEDELNGLSHVDAIRLNAEQAGDGLDRVVVRMKNTDASTLSSMDNSGLTTVYDHGVQLSAGENTLTLTQPFTWAGTGNNILVDVAVEDHTSGAAPVLTATQAGGTVLHAGSEGHLAMTDGRVGVNPSVLAGISDQITISFRVFGDASLPMNNSFLEGLDAQGNRVLNIHLPWGNSNVYWDAGANGIGGYDRISKAASSSEIQGQWNYWAFTKNTTTGIMRIYLNGVQWQSGTGMTASMAGITSMNIGTNGVAENPWPGQLDDVNIFNTELDQATIAAWMNKRIDDSHPDYSSLVLGLPFDGAATSFEAENLAANGTPAWLLGRASRIHTPATELGEGITTSTVRPDLTLVEATYDSHLDSILVAEPAIHAGVALETFAVQGTSLVPSDTLRGWEAGLETTYAPDGSVASTNSVGGNWVVNHDLSFYTQNGEIIPGHEIGRYITPYGINLTLGSGFTWVYDVTDYQYLLHDSVDLSAGNQQELLDLKFLMIEGTPGREVVNVLHPWGEERSHNYGELSDDSDMSAETVAVSPNAAQWAMRSRITGHGDASSSQAQGCCEFRNNTHSLLSNGNTIDSWHVWQTNDCALNPLYPQGGTWLYSREGWCPGDIVKEHNTDLTPYVTGDSINIDYGISPVPTSNPGMAGGNYHIAMDLFEFSAPTHELDAEIYDVLRPSDAKYRSRENPICNDPVVVLRNAGGTELTSATFTYNVSGGATQTYTWNGSLQHMAKTNVALPISDGNFWTGDGEHRFVVSVSAPNGGTDEYADNDSYSTHFNLPPVYDDNIVLNFKTNNRPQDNSVTVTNVFGNMVYSHANLTANTTYSDTLLLGPGCFTMKFMDTGNDGLYYWADTQQGNGYLRFKRLNGMLLKSFQKEFGRSIVFSFAIGSVSNVDEEEVRPSFLARPNPSNGHFTLRTSNVTGPIDLEVYDAMGRLVKTLSPTQRSGSIALDLSDLSNGPYTVRLTTEFGVSVSTVVKQ